MKENLRSESEKQEIMRLSSIKSKTQKNSKSWVICTTNVFNWLKQKQKIFCVCMYEMFVEITKETWGKCGIGTLIYHNKEEKIIESSQKTSDVEIQLGHSNIADVVLKRIRKYCAKKKDITKEEKQKY